MPELVDLTIIIRCCGCDVWLTFIHTLGVGAFCFLCMYSVIILHYL